MAVKTSKKRISVKEKGFVKDWIKTGNGTKAIMNNYNVKSEKVAGVMAVENLAKPRIQAVIARYADRFSDDMLAEKHNELLNQKQVAYFVFPKRMKDEEIEEKVNSAGFNLIVIRFGEKGKYAFYSTNDSNAQKSALDMAYKIKGTYAPEKRSIEIDEELLESIKGRVGNILE